MTTSLPAQPHRVFPENDVRFRLETFGGVCFDPTTFQVAEVDHGQADEIRRLMTRGAPLLSGSEVLRDLLEELRTPNGTAQAARFSHAYDPTQLPGPSFYDQPVELMTAPVRAVFELTHYCNLQCPFCYDSSGPAPVPALQNRELEAEAIASAVAALDRMGACDVTFTGGEPTLYGSFTALCDRLADRPPRFASLCLITNATKVDEELLPRLSIFDQVCVSIDGIGELHDQSRGKRGTWPRTERGLNLLLEAGHNVKVIVTVSRINQSAVRETILTLAERGLTRFDICTVRKLGRIRGDNSLPLNAEELWALRARADELRRDLAGSGVGVVLNTNFFDLDYGKRAVSSALYAEYQPGCQLTIGPRGSVYPDRLWGIETLGSLRDKPIDTIWDDSTEQRRQILTELQHRDAAGRVLPLFFDVDAQEARNLPRLYESFGHWPSRRRAASSPTTAPA